MRNADLLQRIASDARVPMATAEKMLDSFIDAATEAMITDESLCIEGFGTFSSYRQKPKKPGDVTTNRARFTASSRLINKLQ